VVSMTDPYGRILGFLDRNRYLSTLWNRSAVYNIDTLPTPIEFEAYGLGVDNSLEYSIVCCDRKPRIRS
jgi:hypothetical protein